MRRFRWWFDRHVLRRRSYFHIEDIIHSDTTGERVIITGFKDGVPIMQWQEPKQ